MGNQLVIVNTRRITDSCLEKDFSLEGVEYGEIDN